MTVILTAKETEMLLKMSSRPSQQISLLIDKPSTRVANSLVKKGLAKDIMGTFWQITEAGIERLKEIS